MAGRSRATRIAVLSFVLFAFLTLDPLARGMKSARAQVDAGTPPPAVSSAPTRAVGLRVAGPRGDTTLEDTIRELVSRLHLVVVDAETTKEPVVARVMIDQSSPSDAVILVTDGRTGEVRLHRSVPRDTSPAIVREEVAHAVQSAVEAQLVTEHDRAAQPPPPPTAAPPPPAVVVVPPPVAPVREQPRAPARPSPFGLDLTTLAGVGPIASGAGPTTRIGLGAVAMAHTGLRPSIALTLLYAVPFDTGTPEVSSHASIASVRAIPAIEILHASWLAVDLGAGGGVDLITVSPRSDQLPASSLGSETTRADVILTAGATARVALAPGVVFLLSAAAEADLASREYVLTQGTTESEVLAPWRVRPMLLAGFGFTALGDGRFAANGAR